MKQARADQECLEHENMRPSVKWRPSDYEAFCCLSCTSKFMRVCLCVFMWWGGWWFGFTRVSVRVINCEMHLK